MIIYKLIIVLLSGAMLLPSSQNKKHVIFFGDSITELGIKRGGYIRLIDSIAEADNNKMYEFSGAGVSSDKIYDLYLRIEKDVIERKPDVVVIFIGVNDVWHKSIRGTGTDENKFVRFYQAVIDKLISKKVRVILATPAVIGEKVSGNPLDKDLDKYCEIVKALAVKNKLGLVDLRHAFQEHNKTLNKEDKFSGILTYDGVHLSDYGNQLVAKEMWKRLKIE